MSAQAVHAPPEPIVVFRSVRETYALEPRSLDRVRKEFGPTVQTRSRIFIAHETLADNDHIQGEIAGQVIHLLTGVVEERLRPLGGVVFRDPVTERDLSLAE
jgi:hypothetical protein